MRGHDGGADESGDAAGHVHDARARKVDLATQERLVIAPCVLKADAQPLVSHTQCTTTG